MPSSAIRPPSSGASLVLPGDRAADVVSFENAVVSYFVDAADMLGVPKSVAAIYGICFASPEPLSFSDIDERLDISSGSISQGLRVLKEVGALKAAVASPRGSLLVVGGSFRSNDRSTEGHEAHEGRNDGVASPTITQSGSTGDNGGNGESAAEAATDPFSEIRVSVSQRSTIHEERTTPARSAQRYEPDLELRKLILHWMEKRLETQLKSGSNRLEQIQAKMPQSVASAEVLQQRFESLAAWHAKARALLPIAKTFFKLT